VADGGTRVSRYQQAFGLRARGDDDNRVQDCKTDFSMAHGVSHYNYPCFVAKLINQV
jgi:hypothetical protein